MKVCKLVAVLAAWVVVPALAEAAVVINEVFYNAPDDLEDLEWVEVHNTGQQAMDLSGWAFTKGIRYTFPKDTAIEPNGYLVVCRNPQRFQQYHKVPALGGFDSPLSNKGERIDLADAAGNPIDSMKYDDKEPWSTSADGGSASLERICPGVAGDLAANWAASPLSMDGIRPGGTPGQQNACYSEQLPPIIAKVTSSSDDLAPGQALRIEAEIRDEDGLQAVSLLYRVATATSLTPETAIAMEPDPATGRYSATIPPQKAGCLIRYRIKAVDQKQAQRLYPAEHDLRPTFSTYVHEKYEVGQIPLGLIINVPKQEGQKPQRATPRRSVWGSLFGGDGPQRHQDQRFRPPLEAVPPQGFAAFVYVDQKTGQQTLFDYITVTERSGGYKVRFHKDRPLNGMTTISLILEDNERFVLAEPLAYELFHRVGNAAPLTDFVRVWVDGRPRGYHLLIEQPNKAFLHRNQIADGGDLYKLTWVGQGLIGQHEKKTNPQTGHGHLVALVEQLQKTQGEEQWKLIEQHFNVPQVVNYFAVSMCLSDWDGFFNNYFTYHDLDGTKKWEIYPWDRDKTWGFYDGIARNDVFIDMPLTFGMEGDRPFAQGNSRQAGPRSPFGRGMSWWRPGGYFSRPLLANPQFRKLFLARTKEIAETVYTQEVFFPIMDAMETRLLEEVRVRAISLGTDPDAAVAQLRRNMQSLKEHLNKRRKFILEQPEIRALDGDKAN